MLVRISHGAVIMQCNTEKTKGRRQYVRSLRHRGFTPFNFQPINQIDFDCRVG